MLTTNIQFSYLKNGLWNSFSGTSETSMDGIKIQTPANSSYYLKYRTWNSGKTNWYSRVDSNTDDYAFKAADSFKPRTETANSCEHIKKSD